MTLYILVILIFVIVAVNTLYSYLYKVVNMPSSPQTRQAIIADLKALKGDAQGLHIYELGSGWGGLTLRLARHFPHATVIGFEISPVPYCVSLIRRLCVRKNRYTLRYGDIFKQDLSAADIIICYLSPYHMKRLEPMIPKNATVYTQGFPFPDRKADQEIPIKYGIENTLYRYDF